MKIKRYIVDTMKEALVRAKYELGKDAIIIDQRTIKVGKWFNPFKEEKLEVTFGIEEVDDIKEEEIKIEDNIEVSPVDSLYINSSKEIKERLISYCKLHSKENLFLSREENKEFMRIVLKDNPLEKEYNLGKINAVLGPTGVGKTTTLAKIAAKEILENKKNVGLITMDTYRIGAVEQLRTYANILGAPFEIVNEPSEMIEKIKKLNNCDIILIDTFGTSPKNHSMIENINNYFKGININKYLVLNISSDKDTTVSILNQYKKLNYDSLILTKLDEVDNLSNIWHVLENNSLPIEFICFGQSVPDDIKKASLDNFMDFLEETKNVRPSYQT